MSPQLLDALEMFVFLAVELSALFIGISLLVGLLQRHIPPAKVEALLSARRGRSYVLAAALGAVTPFCSCSTIPMLKGLIRARAGFGPMMVFLFASPLLNPVIVALLAATFGLRLTGIYVLAALGVSLGAGWLLQALGFERHVRREDEAGDGGCGADCRTADETPAKDEAACCGAPAATTVCCSEAAPAAAGGGPALTTACCTQETPAAAADCCASAAAPAPASGRYHGLWREAWSDFLQVLPYLVLGIAVGSLIYGFVPTGLLERYAGADNLWAVPVAAVIGVPLYIRAEAVIPLAGALLAKGVSAGAVLALIIGSAGASLTELILLRALFTWRLLAVFVVVVFAMAMTAGYTAFLFF